MAREIEPEFALADWELEVWTSQKFIRIEEGVMLLVNASPRHAFSQEFEQSTMRKLYRFCLDLVGRELVGREFSSREVSPIRFLEMAKACKVIVPADVEEAIQKNRRDEPAPLNNGISNPPAPLRPNEAAPDPRILDTLYTIIYGLAVEKYRYEPDSSRSEVPAKIEAVLNRQGFTLSAKTIRTHLRTAADVVKKGK